MGLITESEFTIKKKVILNTIETAPKLVFLQTKNSTKQHR